MKQFRKTAVLAQRTLKEMLRDPLTLFFGLAFPILILLLLSLIQSHIPVDMFRIEQLAPGIVVFGQSFLSLFGALLIARDRSTSFLMRLYAAPVTGLSFLLGYLLPLLPLALMQGAAVYAVALLLGLPAGWALVPALLAGLVCSLLFIAIGLLCGTVLNDKQVGGACGALLTNLTAWLSGIWFDISLLGDAFGSVARAGLRLRVALLMQRRRERKAELLRRRFRQQTRLIVPALAQSPAAQRHPRDEVVLPRQLRAHRAGNEAAVDLGIPRRAAEFVAQERRAHIAIIIERRDARADERKALPSAVLRKRQAGPAVRADAVAARLEKIMAECAPRRIEQVKQECDHLHIAPHSPQSRARRPL